MKILGIDYGKKNIGLALYDTTVRVAIPFGVVLSAEIAAVVSSEHIDQIVIGLPLGLDGKENDATVRVRKFGEELKKTTGCLIDFCDERFTSVVADRFDSGISRDEKAAMVILEGWVEKNNFFNR